MTGSLLTILILHWAVLVTPGPNVIVVSQLAASGQRRAALFSALGVTTVACIWAALAVLGVHAVFVAHAGIRRAVQVAGGLYLLLLAWKLWQSGEATIGVSGDVISAWDGFRRGFVANILNPKSALFFGSVFATALPAEPSNPLLVLAVAVVLVDALLWHVLLALAFSRPRVRLAYSARRQHLDRLAATLAAAFGLRLEWQVLREL